ncbi:leucine-rich repeat domain-containing protein [Mycoplasma simbae]|uniref:leucine-rich repeat domain-containing protein n=1 Tax=Mycoplasma simbae TaxID=36744 RepID=UPI000495D9D0|nr:leucine-rich repeat domain-containing protein [Mycoplasma simbae]
MKLKNKLFLALAPIPSLAPIAFAASCNIHETIEGDTYVKFRSHTQTELIIPDYVTKIKFSAFHLKKKLAKITAKNVTELDPETFHKSLGSSYSDINLGLQELRFDSLGQIEPKTLKDLINLTTFYAPSVTKVGEEAFAQAKSLSNLTLGQISEVGKAAFKGTSDLTQAPSFAPSLTHLPDEIFRASGIKSFSSANITSIGELAFRDSAIESIDLPNVTSFGKRAFANAQFLKNPKPTNFNININAEFDEEVFGTSTKNIHPSWFDEQGLFIINGHLFMVDAARLGEKTELELPESVKVIEPYAFKNGASAKLTTIRSNSVLTVKAKAFNNNKTITTVEFPNAQIEPDAYKGSSITE